jgi:hypothetical protein
MAKDRRIISRPSASRISIRVTPFEMGTGVFWGLLIIFTYGFKPADPVFSGFFPDDFRDTRRTRGQLAANP